MKCLSVASIGLHQIALAATGSDWSYDDQSAWPGMCAEGKSQSPISIETAAVDQSVILKDLQINYGPIDDAGLSISNYGIGVSVEGEQKEYNIGNVRMYEEDTFVLDHFHAHWGLTDESGSEHLLEGMAHPMEVHFVHYNEKYGSVGDDKGKAGGLAVLGVFFEIGDANPEIEKILEAVKTGSDTFGSIDLYGLIPEDAGTKFFGYDGSLTTPTCDENLLWHVAKTTMTMSEDQMKMLRSAVGPDGDVIAPNYRDAQPLNGRKVYITEGLKEEVNLYCHRVCDGLSSCGDSKYGSYCKGNGVCYGLYHKDDGYCFQPTESDTCDDSVLEPVMCSPYTTGFTMKLT
ncbi:hypothetical protein FOZ61_007491 [Perkinsus olseni]|uniref:Carbonic anhydrase n=1 Tax=Perkinsus olseni TaxID=32597 RepID=A0A7J6L8R8_PEROL|nr:hypothetical protein FOZ61_007491 [Perkinsus olseni]